MKFSLHISPHQGHRVFPACFEWNSLCHSGGVRRSLFQSTQHRKIPPYILFMAAAPSARRAQTEDAARRDSGTFGGGFCQGDFIMSSVAPVEGNFMKPPCGRIKAASHAGQNFHSFIISTAALLRRQIILVATERQVQAGLEGR